MKYYIKISTLYLKSSTIYLNLFIYIFSQL